MSKAKGSYWFERGRPPWGGIAPTSWQGWALVIVDATLLLIDLALCSGPAKVLIAFGILALGIFIMALKLEPR